LQELRDDLEKRLRKEQMENWKKDMTIAQLQKNIVHMGNENVRLKNVKDLSSSLVFMPEVCF